MATEHKEYHDKFGNSVIAVRPYAGGFTIWVNGWPNDSDRCRTEEEAQARLDKRAEERGYREARSE